MSEGQRDCQSEVRDVFEKLISWREESHQKFSDIINSHSRSINWGINGLVEDVGKLQAELSVIRNERKVLLETVDSLNGEIRHLNAKLQPLPGPEEYIDNGHQGSLDLQISEEETETLEKSREIYENDGQEVIISHENVPKSALNTTNKQPLNDLTHTALEDDDTHSNENLSMDRGAIEEKDERQIEEHEESNEERKTREKENSSKSLQCLSSDIKEKMSSLSTTDSKEVNSEDEDISDQDVEQKSKDVLNDQDNLNDSSVDESEGADDLEELVCPECEFAFSANENLKIHLKNVHSKSVQSKVTQQNDDKMSKVKSDGVHSRSSSSDDKNTKVSWNPKLENGNGSQESNKELQCQQCPFNTKFRSSLKRHKNTVHDKAKSHACNDSEIAAPERREFDNVHTVKEPIFQCEICPFTSAQKTKLQIHRASIHKIKAFKCELCPYASVFKASLVIHNEGKHGKIRRYVCEDCGYAAKLRRHLKQHREDVHESGNMKFQCDKCTYETVTTTHLNRHLRDVHNMEGRELQCELCSYSSFAKWNLKAHIEEVHKRIRKYICEECGYATIRKGNLKIHMEGVHKKIEEEKRFKCKLCSFSSTKTKLKVHIDGVHCKEKDHICEVCEHAFSRNAHLKRHIESVHNMGIKKFKCDLCPHETYYRHKLKRHVANVHQMKM